MIRQFVGALLLATCSAQALAQCALGLFQSPLPTHEDLGRDVTVVGDLVIASVIDLEQTENHFVQIYKRDGAGLTEIATLQGPDPDGLIDTDYGDTLDANPDSDWIAVADDCYLPEIGPGGAVFLYDRDTFEFHSFIFTPDPTKFNRFGRGVALTGDRLVVGAVAADNGDFEHAGLAFAYRFENGQWFQQQTLSPPDPEEFAGFGWTIDVSGDHLLIGAHGVDRVYAYKHDGEQWVYTQTIESPVGDSWFGFDVAISQDGSTAVIGAPQDLGQSGSAFVYERDGDAWQQAQKLVAENPVGPWSFLGRRVSISADGGTVLAGAPDDWESGAQNGALHVFQKGDSGYIETAKIPTPNTHAASFAFAIGATADHDIAYAVECDGPSDTCGLRLLAGLRELDCDNDGVSDTCQILEGDAEDVNGDGVPDHCQPPACLADPDASGLVDSADLNLVLGVFGNSVPPDTDHPADLNDDGAIDTDDLNMVLGAFGDTCG